MVENGRGKRQTGPECLSILFSQLVLYLPQLVWLLRQSMAPPRFLLYRGMAAAKMWVIQTSFSFHTLPSTSHFHEFILSHPLV